MLLASGAALATALAGRGARAQLRRRSSPSAGSVLLDKATHADLAYARAVGFARVSLVLVCAPDETEAIARAVGGLNGVVKRARPDLGYLRIELATDRVSALLAISGIKGIEFSRIPLQRSGRIPPFGPASNTCERPMTVAEFLRADAVRERHYEPMIRQPYNSRTDMNADQWIARNPTWDGRGVTVIHYEPSAALINLPGLTGAKSIDGREIPKVVDIMSPHDPTHVLFPPVQEFWNYWPWADMRLKVEAVGGRFIAEGQSWRAPRDGRFRLGFQRRIGYTRWRLPNCQQMSERIAILWDPEANRVWVDTGQTRDFSGKPSLTDFSASREIGHFDIIRQIPSDEGTFLRPTPSAGSTAFVTDRAPFTVQTDRENLQVALHPYLNDAHAEFVAFTVSGAKDGGSELEGVAPASRLLFYNATPYSVADMIEGLVKGLEDPRGDVLLYEPTSNPPSFPPSGNPVAAKILQRAAQRSNKILVGSMGNNAGVSHLAMELAGEDVLAIGACQSNRAWQTNFGIDFALDMDRVAVAIGQGPGRCGEIKPDLLAPTGMLTRIGDRSVGELDGLYRMRSHWLSSGTSGAAPTAAGAIALLLSAARQSRRQFSAADLRWALRTAARYLPNMAAHSQGHGVIDIAAAWALLENPANLTRERYRFSVVAPVRNATSHLLDTPHQGVGLFEREGWKPGDRGRRHIEIVRLNGPAEELEFELGWLGNAGTFVAPRTVRLARGVRARVPIDIHPRNAGAHSALLSLRHGSQPGDAHRIMCMVVAAPDLRPDHWHEEEVQLARPSDAHSLFVRVPAGTRALTVKQQSSAGTWRLSVVVRPPSAERINEWVVFRGAYTDGVVAGEKETALTIDRPMPGVWELIVGDAPDFYLFDQSRPVRPPANPVKILVGAMGVTVEASRLTGNRLELDLVNRGCAFQGSVVDAVLGSAKLLRGQVRPGSQEIFDIEIEPGVTQLRLLLSTTSEADLDLFLIDSTGEIVRRSKSSVSLSGREEVVVGNPSAGRWQVVVDAFGDEGQVPFELVEVQEHERFGHARAAEAVRSIAAGERWTTSFTVERSAAPGSGRLPALVVNIAANLNAAGGAPTNICGSVLLLEPNRPRLV